MSLTDERCTRCGMRLFPEEDRTCAVCDFQRTGFLIFVLTVALSLAAVFLLAVTLGWLL